MKETNQPIDRQKPSQQRWTLQELHNKNKLVEPNGNLVRWIGWIEYRWFLASVVTCTCPMSFKNGSLLNDNQIKKPQPETVPFNFCPFIRFFTEPVSVHHNYVYVCTFPSKNGLLLFVSGWFSFYGLSAATLSTLCLQNLLNPQYTSMLKFESRLYTVYADGKPLSGIS